MRQIFRLLVICGCALSLYGCGSGFSSGKSASSHSDNEEVLLRIAHVTESGGDNPEAEKLFRQAVDRAGNAIEPRLELADFYLRHNGPRQAITVLQDALKLQPQNVAVSRQLANAYISAALPEDALPVLEKAITLNNKDAFLYNSQGVALDALGRYAQAQQSYKTALQLSPDDAMTFDANLSMSYIVSGHYDEAVHLLSPLINMPGATAVVRQNLALAYGLNGQKDLALKLGMKDLPAKEAEENLKFYRMVTTSQNSQNSEPKNLPSAEAAISPSVVTSIFKDSEAEVNDDGYTHEKSQPVTEPLKPAKVTENTIAALPKYTPSAGGAAEKGNMIPTKSVGAPVQAAVTSASTGSAATADMPIPVLKPDNL